MKGLLVVGGFLAVVVVAFVVVLRISAGTSSDVDLTRSATGVVTASEPEKNYVGTQSRGHRVDYRYEVDGRWYASEEWVPEDLWVPGRSSVPVCVLPDDPADHTVPTRVGASCGDDTLGLATRHRAEDSSAP